MKVGLDISPLRTGHKVRGIGFYTQRLRDNLEALAKRRPDFTLVEFSGRRKDQVDLVHYPYFHPYFRTLPIFKKTKTVVTVHDLIPVKFPNHFPPGIKGSFRWQLQRLALKTSKVVITDSFSSQKDLVELARLKQEKVKVVYLAADSIFKPIKNRWLLKRLRERYQLPKKFFMYVGGLNWNKNVVMLAKVCLKLKYPLVVVGKQAVMTDYDPMHPENKEMAKFHSLAKEHPQQLLRLGFVPTEDLVGIYNLATGYVQPSFAEGFGLPVLEAMQSGCPVITSRTTSLAEIAGEAGLLIDSQSQQTLVKALKTVWQKVGARRRLVNLGKKQAAKFSWEKTAEETLRIYRQVVG